MNGRTDQLRRRQARLGAGSSRVVWVLLLAALALTVGGCGKKSSSTLKGKKGGTITVLTAADVDYIDPGETYYAFGYEIVYTTQRPLYGYKADSLVVVPDLAASEPQVTDGGLTVTVKLKKGVKFSPPVNREVTSKDVKYAIERGFAASVINGYAGAYFSVIKGAPATPPKTPQPISGIETPDDHTIVFKLSRPSGALIGALTMPLTAPVPEEYAKKYDDLASSTYGMHQVATGPYMIANNAAGSISPGYQPSKLIKLVRNPNWSSKTDYRPAFADQIRFEEGYADATIATRKILSGTGDVNGDFAPPPAQLKSILANPVQKKRLFFTPVSGTRDVALNSTKPPFNNLHVRQAVAYVLDRNAMRLTRGGAVDGKIATHFIDPSFAGAGFEAAGGYAFDPFPSKNHAGDVAKAKAEMKLAGYKTGMYTGPPVTMVAGNAGAAPNTARVVINNLGKIGIKVTPSFLSASAMYTEFCNVPKKEPAVCPNVGWLQDFKDAQTLLDVTFNGKDILQAGNSNWGQLNDPKINAAIDAAEKLTDKKQRAAAWGKIDDMITLTAVEIPWIWEDYQTIFSANVNPARQLWNQGGPDLSWMSKK
ncbi:MAG: ABC transporter substrate-binding protein [Gaiellaceae bacterium]